MLFSLPRIFFSSLCHLVTFHSSVCFGSKTYTSSGKAFPIFQVWANCPICALRAHFIFCTIILSVYFPVSLRLVAQENRCYIYSVLYSFLRTAEAQQIFIELNWTLDNGEGLIQILALSSFRLKWWTDHLTSLSFQVLIEKLRLFSTLSIS